MYSVLADLNFSDRIVRSLGASEPVVGGSQDQLFGTQQVINEPIGPCPEWATTTIVSHLGLGRVLKFEITVYGTKKEHKHFNLRDENMHATKKRCYIVRDEKNTLRIYMGIITCIVLTFELFHSTYKGSMFLIGQKI